MRTAWPRDSRGVHKSLNRAAKEQAIPDKIALLARARPGELYKGAANFVYPAEVADQHVGLLIIDGELVKTLKPGLYAYWRFNRTIKVEQVDTRL